MKRKNGRELCFDYREKNPKSEKETEREVLLQANDYK